MLRDLVAEAMPAERLLDELAAKMVASDLGDAIELAERGELVDDSLRRERRARFADGVDDNHLVRLRRLVRDRKGH